MGLVSFFGGWLISTLAAILGVYVLGPALGFVFEPLFFTKLVSQFSQFLASLGVNWLTLSSVAPPSPQPITLQFIAYWASLGLFMNVLFRILYLVIVGVGHSGERV